MGAVIMFQGNGPMLQLLRKKMETEIAVVKRCSDIATLWRGSILFKQCL